FPDATWMDLGGGLGVPEQPGQHALDLARLGRELGRIRAAHPSVSLRLEPGRFLVSEAGVLIAPVTQVRTKGGVHLAGLATGMNSLVRPALYGAWHRMHNLSRLGEPPVRTWQIVGPICESADVLGRDRRLPDPEPGDVLLIENAGAYGAVMASRYNLREPAEEIVLE
ncbi:MAG TPA: bifunctional aspartate kinase/diaminopimelate decarboxylase, partial [Candidatus Eisenbacteria bacterium]|nr:bifunctional aspartate kinase/diaminopimelate decarboxylase [Candidatus Eisenbacteria bacterium]